MSANSGGVRFVCKRPVKDPALRLFCFPYAGGGVVAFRQWPDRLPPRVEMHVLEMPGREMRLHEPGFIHVDPLVRAIDASIKPYLHEPFAFFGHSMGALVSFELARFLRREHSVEPAGLFPSGRPAPQLPIDLITYNLPEKEFIEDIRRRGGTPDEVLDHPELLQLVLPTLRADFQLCQTYEYKHEPPFKSAVTVYGGLNDQFGDRRELDLWSEQTTGPFEVRMFPGDHFFLHSSDRLLLQTLSKDLLTLIAHISKP